MNINRFLVDFRPQIIRQDGKPFLRTAKETSSDIKKWIRTNKNSIMKAIKDMENRKRDILMGADAIDAAAEAMTAAYDADDSFASYNAAWEHLQAVMEKYPASARFREARDFENREEGKTAEQEIICGMDPGAAILMMKKRAARTTAKKIEDVAGMVDMLAEDHQSLFI